MQGGPVISVDVLTRFAQECGDPGVPEVAARLAAPLRVAVSGRAGVGRTTVTRVLTSAGWLAVDSPDNPDNPDSPDGAADVAVVVVAEAVKPEDRSSVARWRGSGVPVLVVGNKADLTGAVPLEALRRAAGAPVVSAAALLADVTLDDDAVGALRALVAHPADPRSPDAFLDGAHPVAREPRLRLLRLLGRTGIAHSVRALSDGADPGDLPALLREASGVDRVLDRLDSLAAPARYRRVRAALAELQALAAGSRQVAEFLASDDAVLATMTAAVDVVEATGLEVDPADDPAAHLRRAVRWRTYSRGPVNPLHRACGADICRGSLRLLERRR
ncbi:hypothetical protein [Mycolicibacterium baixiangningiae]|uniref:hypothetical protein n=1 Tax=Mycolicibacterium baixiangningiae TaxID=2761578 RepID=UPI001866F22B|nr:hypothetical protein [Mycolicibacterium baixiangningiae]